MKFLGLLGFKYGNHCRFSGIRTRRNWDVHNSLVVGDNVIIRGQDIRIGRNVSIASFSVINTRGGSLVIGPNSSINEFSKLSCLGGVTIGSDVRMGSHLNIVASSHIFGNADIPISKQGLSAKGVVIENNVWIGCNVVVLDGVTIGHGSVVAAGSVVNKSIPPGSVCAGVPAKVINHRFNME